MFWSWYPCHAGLNILGGSYFDTYPIGILLGEVVLVSSLQAIQLLIHMFLTPASLNRLLGKSHGQK